MLEGMVPARYIGANKIQLSKLQGPGYDQNGQRRSTLAVEQGDVLMMPEREVVGQTLLFDPQGERGPQDLGAGRRVKPEHAELSAEELELLGYQFHYGRPDFELVVPAAQPATQESPPVQTAVASSKKKVQQV